MTQLYKELIYVGDHYIWKHNGKEWKAIQERQLSATLVKQDKSSPWEFSGLFDMPLATSETELIDLVLALPNKFPNPAEIHVVFRRQRIWTSYNRSTNSVGICYLTIEGMSIRKTYRGQSIQNIRDQILGLATSDAENVDSDDRAETDFC